MMHFLHLYWIPLLFFVVGLFLWLVPKTSPRLSEFGKIVMAAGIFTMCLSFTQHRIWP
jgi:vacuolar-type H+-ATPase subunit I/STV1